MATQLWRAAASAVEFSKPARSVSSSDIAIAGDAEIPMHPNKSAAVMFWRIFSIDMICFTNLF